MNQEVDIVIPVYNRIEFLPEAIQSVFNQTFQEWNLYIVDDGSEVDVKEFLSQELKDSRLHLLRQENQGNAAARNTGIHAGSAPYVAMLDSDDIWEPSYLRVSVGLLSNESKAIDIVVSGHMLVDEAGVRLIKQPIFEEFSENLLDELLLGKAILPSTAIIKRKIFNRWGGFIDGLDDWELWMRYAWNGCVFTFINQRLVRYRVHSSNLHLNWKIREQTHFAMLDYFFATPGLSNEIIGKKSQAYAWQHFQFGIQALNNGNREDASSNLQAAVVEYPQLLKKNDTYWKITCAHQAMHEMGTKVGYSAEQAKSSVLDYFLPLLKKFERKLGMPNWNELESRSYYVLGIQAYGLINDYRLACKYLMKSLLVWPALIGKERPLRMLIVCGLKWLIKSCRIAI